MGQLRLPSGEVVEVGWLAADLPFLTRTLRFLFRPESDVMRRDLGLEPGEIGILAVIAQNPGISQNGLASSVVLKKSAVTKVVQALEKRGLVKRTRSETDRRSNELSLTAEGEAMCQRMRAMSADLHDVWFDGVPEADRAAFFDVMFRLVGRLAERGGELPRGGVDDD